MNDDQMLQMQQMQEMKQNLQQMQQQLQLLEHQLLELDQVKDTIVEMKKSEKGQEILVPLGAGVFTKATIKDNEKIIMNVGSSVAVDKTLSEAEELVLKQIEELQKIQEQMNVEFAGVSQQMQFLQMSQQAGN